MAVYENKYISLFSFFFISVESNKYNVQIRDESDSMHIYKKNMSMEGNKKMCSVENFIFFSRDASGKEKINFALQFKGQQDETLQEYILGILIENAPRTTVDGQISIVVGPLAVYEQSLAIEQQTVAAVTTASPGGGGGSSPSSKISYFI